MAAIKHLAIIMDGNGRWAQARGHNRTYGHVRGARVARAVIREAGQQSIKFLTLYAFSTENWQRPAAEVSLLMRLLEKYLRRELATLMDENVKFKYVGDISALPQPAIRAILDTVEATKHNSGLTLVFALNYGGRQEITLAVRQIAKQIEAGQLTSRDVTESLITNALETSFMPDPDLIIRTSGEQRLSNFLLWQAAYSELYFTETAWPDFKVRDLRLAIDYFHKRERRFGKVLATGAAIFSAALKKSHA
jgi:undecaprenyl diphosphate synthase